MAYPPGFRCHIPEKFDALQWMRSVAMLLLGRADKLAFLAIVAFAFNYGL